MESLLPPEAMHDSNEFRRKYCYLPLMEQVLVKYAPSLHAIFDRYAALNTDRADVLQTTKQLSVGEWMTFLEVRP